MAADDDVGARGNELLRERALVRTTGIAASSMPQWRNTIDGVGGRSRLAHGLAGAWNVLRGREPRLARPGRPRRDQLVVEHLRGTDERDALPLIVRRNGRYACSAFSPIPTTGKR